MDPDGKHITCLLINVFYKLFPELIYDGRVYVTECPLYGTTIDGQFIPIFTKEDKDKYNNEGYSINRFKGLGKPFCRE